VSWLVDVKGRRFPSGDEQKQYWKNWSTRDDLRSLAAGITERTGARGRGVFRPLRLALPGKEEGPELGPLLELMGPERVRSRLAARAAGATTRTDQA
jgi:glutamyl-tRNA synthetase